MRRFLVHGAKLLSPCSMNINSLIEQVMTYRVMYGHFRKLLFLLLEQCIQLVSMNLVETLSLQKWLILDAVSQCPCSVNEKSFTDQRLYSAVQ